ncbi:MAG: aminotransferase class V-fold PLP-dependent enzyme [Oscillospiraceae bacterium]|nr:aminotransferase class V-fold PLP-dependent enzyme [Oscillospiraceae bacterium]
MIYLDSAATSFQKPPQVLRAFVKTLGEASSPGRGAHRPAMRAADAMLDMREDASAFFHFKDPERVVMTMNATHALNIAVRSLVRKGGRAVVSAYEHNAVIRPLHACGAEIDPAGGRAFDSEELLRSFREKLPGAALAVCTHVSNVFGYILPIREIAALCRENGVPLIVDASQSAGVLPLDAEELQADYIAMPGHKSLLGVPGSGLLLCGASAEPLLFGGSGSDSLSREMPPYLPDRLEAGTQNAPAASALSEGIRFIRRHGREHIEAHEKSLCRHMVELLHGKDGIELFLAPDESEQSGVLSLRITGRDCEEVASRLAADEICVRSGLHCAPLAHKSVGTLESGTVRLSFSPFNTHGEIEKAAAKLIKII